MDHHAKLAAIADAVIRRVVSETERSKSIDSALSDAYPFGDFPLGREIWAEALSRNAALITKTSRNKQEKTS